MYVVSVSTNIYYTYYIRTVRPDAPCGIGQRGAVLDLHSDERVCIVRAPNLRTVVQHAGIEPATLIDNSMYTYSE